MRGPGAAAAATARRRGPQLPAATPGRRRAAARTTGALEALENERGSAGADTLAQGAARQLGRDFAAELQPAATGVKRIDFI